MTVWNPLKGRFWEKDNFLGRNKAIVGKKKDGHGIPNDGWEKCPRCESGRVQQLGKGSMFLILFGSGSCLIWIAILFFPIFIIAIPLILLSPLAILLPKMNQCKDCNYSWKARKN